MTRTPSSGGETWLEPEVTGEAPKPAAPADRYTRIEPIGAGGMGTVHAAIDTELGRIVALKEAHGDGRLGGRLEREARLTAALDHPGIVTVHDAGRTADGRPYYTMRLVRGESLARRLARQTDLRGRLQLVRHLLDAAQAVAWAHSHSTVHRDLKPDNIMVGEMGETQVVDWGLAAPTGTRTGVCGTPAYLSPEQARGEPADPRDDVFSLGIVLYELLAGANPRGDGSVAELLARVPNPIPPPPAECPPELVAVASQALALDPARRYPAAKELAADLACWIDGRPVLAHRYTPWELLVRTVKEWRAPLTVGAIALVAFIVMLAATTWRTAQERDRATAAEAEARAALSGALAAHARAAFTGGALPEAEVLAAEALLDREDPDARGVLVGLAAGERPTLLADLDVPTCMRSRLGPAPRTLLCDTGSGVSYWELSPLRQVWYVEGPSSIGQTGGHVYAQLPGMEGYAYLDPADGHELHRFSRRGDLWRTDGPGVLVGSRGDTLQLLAPDGTMTPTRRCSGPLSDARLLPGARVLTVCAEGGMLLTEADPAADWRPDARSTFIGPANWDPVHDRILVVATDASLWAVERGASARRLGIPAVGTATDLRTDPTGRFVAVIGGKGGVDLWDVEAAARVLRLPWVGSRDLGFDGAGNLVELGARYREWSLPAGLAPTAVPLGAGGSAVAISADGAEVAVGLGDGTMLRWSVGAGRVLQRWAGAETAIKGVVYDGQGVSWSGGPNGGWRRTFAGEERILGLGGFLRRMAVLADDTVLGFPNNDLILTGPSTSLRSPLGVNVDVGLSPRRTRLALVGATGAARVLVAGNPVTVGATGFDHDAVTATIDDEGHVYTGGPSGIHGWTEDALPRWSTPHPPPYPIDLAVSGDGRWVAAAGLDGAARIYRASDGLLLAVLRGHDARLRGLAFAVDRPLLATIGWDAQLRLWDLGALDLDAKAAAERAQTWWRMDRNQALASAVR